MDETVVFNFGLLLEKQFANELVEVSRSLETEKPLVYRLGEKSLPHVTILQFPGKLADAGMYWGILSTLDLPQVQLHFYGLAIDRFRNLDGLWLRVKPNREIRFAQKAALEVLGNLDYINNLGDMYEPHATLAAWPSQETLPGFPIPQSVLDRRVATTYTLGVSGPNFQYQEMLHARA